MSGKDEDLSDILGLEPDAPAPEALVDEVPKKKGTPMGKASRALLERSRTYPVGGITKVPRKNTPERLKRLLSYVAETAVAEEACSRANIHISTLKWWLQKSLEGRPGDGFDLVLGDDDETGEGENNNSIRFHTAWTLAIEAGVGLVEKATMARARGYEEVLTYQGRVIYKLDPDLVEIAIMLGDEILDGRNPGLWLRDKYGAPVPETVWKMDPDLAMFILKARKPQTYGAKTQIDFNVKGGVLVIPMRAATSEDLNTIEAEYRESEKPLVTFEDTDDTEDNT